MGSRIKDDLICFNAELRPSCLAILWVNLKIEFEQCVSRFFASEFWSWKDFCVMIQNEENISPTNAYFLVLTDEGTPEECDDHFLKVHRLILQTAKEFWLPTRKIIGEEPLHQMNETISTLPKEQQDEEINNLMIAGRMADFKRKLGGFYVLWSLYWAQPCTRRQEQRIEISPYDFKSMKEFEAELESIPIKLKSDEEGEGEARKRFTEEVQFMLRRLVVEGAYHVCVVAENYNLYDHHYLNVKYTNNMDILEKEKHMNERLIFHPEVVKAFAALKEAKQSKQNVEKVMDPIEMDLVLAVLRNPQGRTEIVAHNSQSTVSTKSASTDEDDIVNFLSSLNPVAEHVYSKQPQNQNVTSARVRINAHEETRHSRPSSFIPGTSKSYGVREPSLAESKKSKSVEKFEALRESLEALTLTSPYKMKDCLSPYQYQIYRYMKRKPKPLNQSKRFRGLEKKLTTEEKLEEKLLSTSNDDDVFKHNKLADFEPVLQALVDPTGTSDLSKLKEALRAFLKKRKKANKKVRKTKKSTTTKGKFRRQKIDLGLQPEWELIYSTRLEEFQSIAVKLIKKRKARAEKKKAKRAKRQKLLRERIVVSGASSSKQTKSANRLKLKKTKKRLKISTGSTNEQDSDASLASCTNSTTTTDQAIEQVIREYCRSGSPIKKRKRISSKRDSRS